MWIGASVVLLAWLVPAALVSLYDPGGSHEARPIGQPFSLERLLEKEESRFFLFAHGYEKSWNVATWEGEVATWEGEEDEPPPDAHRWRYHVERGTLDRKAATFPFLVVSGMNHAQDLEAVRLLVTSDGDWSDDEDCEWTLVAETAVESPGEDEVIVFCRGDAPASSIAYKVEEIHRGQPAQGFSQSMLRAPTFLGRVYDRIAWWPAFRWLPDLR